MSILGFSLDSVASLAMDSLLGQPVGFDTFGVSCQISCISDICFMIHNGSKIIVMK